MSKFDKLMKQAQDHMEDGETPIASAMGSYEIKMMGHDTLRTGVLIATNQRLFFYAKKLGGHDIESFPYENVSSFELSKGMLGHKIKAFASGNEIAMKYIGAGDVDGLVREVKARMGKAPAPKASPTALLREYASLRDDGIISEEEFQAKKSELL